MNLIVAFAPFFMCLALFCFFFLTKNAPLKKSVRLFAVITSPYCKLIYVYLQEELFFPLKVINSLVESTKALNDSSFSSKHFLIRLRFKIQNEIQVVVFSINKHSQHGLSLSH